MENADVLFHAAIRQTILRKWLNAVEAWSQCIGENNPIARVFLAEAHVKTGSLAQAGTVLRATTGEVRRLPHARRTLDDIKRLSAATAAKTPTADATDERQHGRALLESGRNIEGLAFWKAALDNERFGLEPKVRLIQIYDRLGEFEDAAALLADVGPVQQEKLAAVAARTAARLEAARAFSTADPLKYPHPLIREIAHAVRSPKATNVSLLIDWCDLTGEWRALQSILDRSAGPGAPSTFAGVGEGAFGRFERALRNGQLASWDDAHRDHLARALLKLGKYELLEDVYEG